MQALAQLPALAQLTLVACPLATPAALAALLHGSASLEAVVVRQTAHEPLAAAKRVTRTSLAAAAAAAACGCCGLTAGCLHGAGAVGAEGEQPLGEEAAAQQQLMVCGV